MQHTHRGAQSVYIPIYLAIRLTYGHSLRPPPPSIYHQNAPHSSLLPTITSPALPNFLPSTRDHLALSHSARAAVRNLLLLFLFLDLLLLKLATYLPSVCPTHPTPSTRPSILRLSLIHNSQAVQSSPAPIPFLFLASSLCPTYLPSPLPYACVVYLPPLPPTPN